MADPLTLADAATELYGVAPADFMATRKALVAAAKANGEKGLAAEIGKLRKPTVGAGVVNALARARPDLMDDLASVGEKLRAAQAAMHGTALTALRPDRDRLIEAILKGAGDVASAAGFALTPAVGAEVRDTVIAALASPDASEAVRSGHLTRALSYSGFGDVDLSDALVRTSSGAVLRLVPGSPSASEESSAADGASPAADEPDLAAAQADREAAREAAAAAYASAAAGVAEAKTAARDASVEVDRLKTEVAELTKRLDRAQAELDKAFEADATARAAVTDAIRGRQEAMAALAEAERASGEG